MKQQHKITVFDGFPLLREWVLSQLGCYFTATKISCWTLSGGGKVIPLVQLEAKRESGIVGDPKFTYFLLVGRLSDLLEMTILSTVAVVIAKPPTGIEIEIISQAGGQSDLELVNADRVPKNSR